MAQSTIQISVSREDSGSALESDIRMVQSTMLLMSSGNSEKQGAKDQDSLANLLDVQRSQSIMIPNSGRRGSKSDEPFESHSDAN